MNKKLLYTYKFLEKTNAKILKSTHTFKNFTHEELSLSWRIKKNTVHSKKNEVLLMQQSFRWHLHLYYSFKKNQSKIKALNEMLLILSVSLILWENKHT